MAKILYSGAEDSAELEKGRELAANANELTFYKNPELLVMLADFYLKLNNKEASKELYFKAQKYNDDLDLKEYLDSKLNEE